MRLFILPNLLFLGSDLYFPGRKVYLILSLLVFLFLSGDVELRLARHREFNVGVYLYILIPRRVYNATV